MNPDDVKVIHILESRGGQKIIISRVLRVGRNGILSEPCQLEGH